MATFTFKVYRPASDVRPPTPEQTIVVKEDTLLNARYKALIRYSANMRISYGGIDLLKIELLSKES